MLEALFDSCSEALVINLRNMQFYGPKPVWFEQKLLELESVKVELTIACLSFPLSLSSENGPAAGLAEAAWSS